ncbi:hypothetical protein LXL04_017154 [Taraxacum kok-saghyz]
MEEALQATKILAQDCRSRGTAFRLGAVLREVLESFLPEDAHIRSDGRLNRFSAILMILVFYGIRLGGILGIAVALIGGWNCRISWLLKCRWFTYLNSDFKKGGWSHEEDMLLCEPQKISATHKYFAGKSAWVFEFLEFCFAKEGFL